MTGTNETQHTLLAYRKPGLTRPEDDVVWRQDGLAVVRLPDGELPNRCLQCNAPADGFRLDYPAPVEVPLCTSHRDHVRRALFVKRAGLALPFVTCFLLAPLAELVRGSAVGALLGTSMLLSLLLILVGSLMLRLPFRILAVRDNTVWIRVGRRFLSSLPPRAHLPTQEKLP
jgi:hypothetical protein